MHLRLSPRIHIGSYNRVDDGLMRRTSVYDIIVMYNMKSGKYLSEVLLQISQKAERDLYSVH